MSNKTLLDEEIKNRVRKPNYTHYQIYNSIIGKKKISKGIWAGHIVRIEGGRSALEVNLPERDL